MLVIASVVAKLIAAGAELLAKEVVRLVRGKRGRDSLPSIDVTVSEPPMPLTHKHVEHIRAQERASIEASKRAASEPHDPMLCDRCAAGVCSGFGPAIDRNATTVGPPKTGKLPRN